MKLNKTLKKDLKYLKLDLNIYIQTKLNKKAFKTLLHEDITITQI